MRRDGAHNHDRQHQADDRRSRGKLHKRPGQSGVHEPARPDATIRLNVEVAFEIDFVAFDDRLARLASAAERPTDEFWRDFELSATSGAFNSYRHVSPAKLK